MRTDKNGRYVVIVPGGSGGYGILVKAIGFAPTRRRVHRIGSEDRLVADIRMSASLHVLADVETRASQDGDSVLGANGTRKYSAEEMRRLGINPNDVAGMAALTPGVFVDSAGGLSVNGQRSSATSTTIDGLPGSMANLPQDAIAGVTIIPNSFDVARRSSGPQIMVRTREGSNTPGGGISVTETNHDMEYGVPSLAVNSFLTSQDASITYEGPIKRGHLFYSVTGDVRYGTTSATSLFNDDPSTLATLGVSQDSVQRLLQMLQAEGLPIGSANTVPSIASSDNETVYSRFDFIPNGDETMTLSLGVNRSNTTPGSVGPLSLPTSASRRSSGGINVSLDITSHIHMGLINSFKIGLTTNSGQTTPISELPAASVVVGSVPSVAGSISGAGFQTIQFGGAGSLPTSTSSTGINLSDEISWLSPTGKHRPKLGGWLSIDQSVTGVGGQAIGAYSYTSLADLQAGAPATFSRLLTSTPLHTGTLSGTIYFGDEWSLSRSVQLSYGVRSSVHSYGELPVYNAAVDSVFHRRTDIVPAQISWEPNVGLQWAIGEHDGHPPKAVLNAGLGVSQAAAPGASGTGIAQTQIYLSCSGAAVPAPVWGGPESTWPSACADGTTGSGGGYVGLPTVTVYNPAAAKALVWTSMVGLQVPVSQDLNLMFNVSGSMGSGIPATTDLNLNPVPGFYLANEGNRAVYASASSIDTLSGAMALSATRLDSAFGQVMSYNTGLHQWGATFSGSMWYMAPGHHMIMFTYDYGLARDQAYFPTPFAATWGPSSNNGQQQVSLALSQPIGKRLFLALNVRASSGMLYTPGINTDVTGGGMGQTPAFIFSPAAEEARGDTALASGINSLLSSGNSSIRDCLLSNMGRIAQRNSCRGPWSTVLGLTLGGQLPIGLASHRLSISVSVDNLLTGLDAVVHGPNHLAGWGVAAASPDPTLLYVEGFNASTQTYTYAVNPRFGSTAANQLLREQPAQLMLMGHLTLGSGMRWWW